MDHEHHHTAHEHAAHDHGSMNKEMHGGHEHHDHAGMINDFKKRFFVSLVLTIPVLLLSGMIQEMLHFRIDIPGSKYTLLALSTLIFIYGGWPFLKGLADELKKKNPGMMTLIAIAITVAYFYSAAVVLGLKGMDFFWELATLIDIMLLGHWIEMRSVAGASRALELLVQMMPAQAHLVRGSEIVDVRTQELKRGDTILVKPGEKIPSDGIITEGESYLNESMLTGESKPVKRSVNDKVIGGSVNGNGSLKIKVENTGEESYLSKVINLVQEAQRSKSQTQHLADRAAFWLTIGSLVIGFGTLFTWLWLGKEAAYAVERMVTVMVIACPHALGLAIPLVVAISTSLSARKGLLIRNRTAFEGSRRITAVVFDKTGTLTSGEFGVTRIVTLDSTLAENDLLRLAGALEQSSEHPIAVGIMRRLKELSLTIPASLNFKAITGKGVEASVEGKQVKVVSPGYLKENNLPIPAGASKGTAETVVFIIIDNKLAGFIALADKVRPESKEAVATLKAHGIRTLMLTGDNKAVAGAVATEIGLDGYFAEVLPHEKLDKIKELQSKGEYVAMTGDGVNDAPALAQADVGIAVGSGTDIAAETADIILVNSNPRDIVSLIMFGRATYRKMIQNLFWATGYNVITLPLATGFIPGIVISPAIGAVFMTLSTVVVALNAQLLKKNMNDTTHGVTEHHAHEHRHQHE